MKLYQRLQQIQSTRGKALALSYKDIRWSYRDFYDQVHRLIEKYQKAQYQGPVAVDEQDPLDLLTHYFAANALGVVICPLAKIKHPHERQRIIDFGQFNIFQQKATQEQRASWPKDANGVIFTTSGTTHLANFIYHSQEHLLSNAQISARWQKFDEQSHILAILTPAHSGGLSMQVLPTLLSGGSVHFLDQLNFEGPTDSYQSIVLVPTQIKRILNSKMSHLLHPKRVRSILTGSMAIPYFEMQQLKARQIQTLGVYGLTEMGPFVATETQFNSPLPDTVSCLGQVLPEYQIRLANDHEIQIQGPCTGAQVHYQKDLHAYHFHYPDWVSTGDLGVFHQGRLYFKGRKKRIINTSGLKYSPEEIESCILAFPGVQSCAVVGVASQNFGEIPIAYIVGDISIKDLQNFLYQRLPIYKIPRKILAVEALPETDIHKPKTLYLKKGNE